MRILVLSTLFILTLLLFFPEISSGQCPMCKISAESNLKNGGDAARGLNSGILYMLAAPYLIMCVIGYMYWKGKKNEKIHNSKDRGSDKDYLFN
jgi:hypothetical protein